MFRKFLMRIRKEYNTNRRRLFQYSAIAMVLSIGVGLAVDFFLPFNNGLWMTVRSLILIPTAGSIFIFSYGVSLYFHYKRMNSVEEWTPYRMRFSPAWRGKISLIIGAVLVVLIYATGQRIGYTLVSSILVAVVIALFAFMRRTRDERVREDFAIPDSRDTRFSEHKTVLDKQREKARLEKARKNKKNIDKFEDDE